MQKFQISLAARVNAGLTQDDVAKALKVGKQTIVSWKIGKSEPKMSQSRELSELYKIPLDYIFYQQNQIKFDIKGIKSGVLPGVMTGPAL